MLRRESSKENILTYVCTHCIALLATSKKLLLRYRFIGVSIVSTCTYVGAWGKENEFYRHHDCLNIAHE